MTDLASYVHYRMISCGMGMGREGTTGLTQGSSNQLHNKKVCCLSSKFDPQSRIKLEWALVASLYVLYFAKMIWIELILCLIWRTSVTSMSTSKDEHKMHQPCDLVLSVSDKTHVTVRSSYLECALKSWLFTV